MLSSSVFVGAQNAGDVSSDTEISLSTPLSSITFTDNTSSDASGVNGSSSFFLFLRMIFVLAFVIGLLYLVFYLLKKTSKVENVNNPFMRVVSKINISAGKSVQIVTVLNHGYLIGVSESGINLISEIDDEELIKSMNVYADSNEQVSRPQSFADVLDMFIPGNKTDKKSVFDTESLSAVDFIKQQRQKLNKE